MRVTLSIAGINLEKLLTEAAGEGIALRGVKRLSAQCIQVRVYAWQRCKLSALCARQGWQMREVSSGQLLRLLHGILKRRALVPASALCIALVFVSSQMILSIRIVNGQENIAEVCRFLEQEGVRIGRMKSAFSTDRLRNQLALRLPGFAFVSLYYEGSTLVVDCHPMHMGENLALNGKGNDVVAAQEGLITRISVQSGTPLVEPGDVVRKGQVLIAGTERTAGGALRDVIAQGQVLARVWARGEARVSMKEIRTVETGAVRTRVMLHSPWHSSVVRDAQPFASQDVSVKTQPVIGLFLPLYRTIETYAQTVEHTQMREYADAASAAQGAAQQIAKKQCPFDALILDKTVEYSMIDNEFLYAAVVLEYEASIAGRLK